MDRIPGCVLLVTPHEDDAEGGCGGTVALWAKAGTRIVYVLCTNGDKGSGDPEMTSELLADVREREQIDAARVLGSDDVVFLRHPDGELEDTLEVRRQIVREVRRYKPDIVLCVDPFRSTTHTHRDHRMSGMMAMDAAFTYAWSPLHFPEQIEREDLQPHRVKAVYLWGSEEPDTYVDISESIDLKIQALAKHESQISDIETFQGWVRNWAKQAGEKAGVRYAEGFRRLSLHPNVFHWAEY